MLNGEENSQIKNILPLLQERLPDYQNKDGEASYNFWRTRPSAHWPFGKFAGKNRFFQIPDDIDDSALAHYLLGGKKTGLEALRSKMLRYANVNIGKKHLFSFPEYRNKKIYNTFFIKNMPCGFDFCALSNVMHVFHDAGLPLCEEDNDSIFFLRQSLFSGQFLHRPDLVSPYYPDSAIILYHAVRSRACLFSEREQIEFLLPKLQDFFASCRRPVQKMMMASSLMKLGANPGLRSLPNETELDDFVFFVAGLFGEFHSPLIRALNRFSMTRVQYHCRTFSDALLFEYLVLKRSLESNEK